MPNYGGVRIEDTILVTADGAENSPTHPTGTHKAKLNRLSDFIVLVESFDNISNIDVQNDFYRTLKTKRTNNILNR